MDVLTLSRIQFAATISFHYIYPPLSIGLGVMLVHDGGDCGSRPSKPVYHQMARFWTKVFALTFAIGVATGIVMEFEFGTNWATYSRYVGDVFGSALAAEGIFAFFLESGFLAVLLFGWDRVEPRHAFLFHRAWFASARISAPSGSSWRTPGCKRRPAITSWARDCTRGRKSRLSGPWFSTRPRWTACFTRCAARGRPAHFSSVSVSAWYLLKKRHKILRASSLRVGLVRRADRLAAATRERPRKRQGRGEKPTGQTGGVRGTVSTRRPTRRSRCSAG